MFDIFKTAVVGKKKKTKLSKASANAVAESNATIVASLGSTRSVSLFKESCFAASQQLRFFECRNLVGHADGISTMEFCTNGSFIVSGRSIDKTVRLCSLSLF